MADPAGTSVSDWTCEGGYNIAHYCDPETDQHDQQTRPTIEDADERQRCLRRRSPTKLQEDAASVFLIHEYAV